MMFFNTLLIFMLYWLLRIVESLSDVSNVSFNYLGAIKFHRLAIHKTNGKVLIGADNGLYELTPDLKSPAGHVSARVDNLTYEIDVLVIDYEANNVIACGWTDTRMPCLAYNCTPDMLSFVGKFSDTLHVRQLAFIGKKHQITESQDNMIPELYLVGSSGKGIEVSGVNLPFGSQSNPDSKPNSYLFLNKANSKETVGRSYTYGFNSGKYNYFLFSECDGKSKVDSVLARLCHNENPLKQGLTSIPIECKYDDELYNSIQAAYVGKPGLELAKSLNIGLDSDVLFGIFSRNQQINGSSHKHGDMSALCIYPLNAIDEKFIENIKKCGSFQNSQCEKSNQKIDSNFCTSNINMPLFGQIPLTATPVITFGSILTAITIKSNENHTDVFIGTNTGHLKKIVVDNSSSACEYDDLPIDEGFPVNSDLLFSPKNDYLYVMTDYNLTKIPIGRAKYEDYYICIQAASKHCDWCGLIGKCTNGRSCFSGEYDAWFFYDFRGNIEIKEYSSNRFQVGCEKPLKLFIVNIPQILFEDKFVCVFTFENIVQNSNATLNTNNSHYIIVSCEMPKEERIPRIPEGKDRLNATLSIQTNYIKNIAKMNVEFFDCKVYTSCENCLSSVFSCHWNSMNGICSHNVENITNMDSCPISSTPSSSYFQHPIEERTTNITIPGVNLMYAFKYINQNITVAGVACIPNEDMHISRKSITCGTSELTSAIGHEGPLEVARNGIIIKFIGNFSFFGVKISEISPKQGPTYGGTQLTIKGEHFDIGTTLAVFIGNVSCAVFLRNSSTIQCITNSSDTENEEIVYVKLNGTHYYFNNSFKYVKDEEHDEKGYNIEPKGIQDGGVEFLLHDVNITLSRHLFLHVHSENQTYESACTILDNFSKLSCLSPRISDISGSIDPGKPKKMDFSFVDRQANKLPFLIKNQSYRFHLYPNPTFYYFLNSSIEFFKNNYLIIFGENIDNACQKTDIKVKVGEDDCEVRSISLKQVVCLLPRLKHYSKLYDMLAEYNNVTVTIGPHFNRTIPKQHHPTVLPEEGKQKHITIAIISVTVIILIIVSVLNYISRKRTVMKYSRTVRNLQQQVNIMGMESIATKQCIKRVIISNKVRLDENSSRILKLPTVAIEDTSVPRGSVGTSEGSEYILQVDHEWEFPRKNLFLSRCLGEGEFGKVLQGEAMNILGEHTITTVAVKMLKDDHSDDDMINLVSEMEILKLIGMHDNVLRLLGCCTADGPLFVITEHAPHGNLLEFLRKHLPSSDDLITMIELSQDTLMMFAMQVAKGMKYLSSIKCIHRDLAARNVLVFDNNLVKIADFGLARDISNKEYYRKKKSGKLPVKWMAPESLCHNFYSTQSDVWSYGILLWEIFTLGGVPYSSLLDQGKLYQKLRSGYRMEIPTNCPAEMYGLMHKCWSFQPRDRPTFSTIVEFLQYITSTQS